MKKIIEKWKTKIKHDESNQVTNSYRRKIVKSMNLTMWSFIVIPYVSFFIGMDKYISCDFVFAVQRDKIAGCNKIYYSTLDIYSYILFHDNLMFYHYSLFFGGDNFSVLLYADKKVPHITCKMKIECRRNKSLRLKRLTWLVSAAVYCFWNNLSFEALILLLLRCISISISAN